MYIRVTCSYLFSGNCKTTCFEWGPEQTVLPVGPYDWADPVVLEVHVLEMLNEALGKFQ